MNGRVRIVDIAQELGVSTATVSNVIHGKTKKISDETVRRVQQLLEEREYIPSMAGILLAQNSSRIIGVILHNHAKYEGHVLEDPFIASAVNDLSCEIERAGYFMMLKTTTECQDIIRFASMWNVSGMVLIGFCEQDYKRLRDNMHIPFVVYDGFLEEPDRICNLVIDNYDGGYQVGRHLAGLGHRRMLCVSDNDICMDRQRYEGFQKAAMDAGSSADFFKIPLNREKRREFYAEHFNRILQYTAIFAVSDAYAVELMQFLMERGIRIPDDLSIAGFDDTPICRQTVPTLTSVRQDRALRAKEAMVVLQRLGNGQEKGSVITLPVTLQVRSSTANCTK
ncbi:MAG: LacI family DNA-binding transcriptional regulator [Lachnospiraceae bacterium]|nr:LacI family DNA-binding transcriptional regulator [Lachnospiraceae bacterium]